MKMKTKLHYGMCYAVVSVDIHSDDSFNGDNASVNPDKAVVIYILTGMCA